MRAREQARPRPAGAASARPPGRRPAAARRWPPSRRTGPARPRRAGARAAPTAIEAVITDSWTPNTRARTWSGTARWSRVRPATSKKLLPAPETASRNAAVAGTAPSGSSISGTPVTRTPTASAGLSRVRPTRATVARAPRMPPMPSALTSRPGPELSVSRTSSATMITRMSRAPTTTYWPATMPTSTAAAGSRRSSRTPAVAPRRAPSRDATVRRPAPGGQGHDQARRREHQDSEQHEHRLGPAGREQQSTAQRAEERADGLGGARGGVAGRELGGGLGQRGQHRVVHRSGQCHRAGDRGAQGATTANGASRARARAVTSMDTPWRP